jgi:CBS domain-containing protein
VLPSLGVTSLDVTTVLFTALIAAFVYVGANATLQRARFLERVPRASVLALARPAIAVPATLPLAEAVRRAQEAGVRGVVVMDGNGQPEAVVSEAAVIAVPEDRRPWVTVSTVARRVVEGMVLDPALEGERLLEAMRRVPATEYVVPHPLRVLTAEDVARVVTPG